MKIYHAQIGSVKGVRKRLRMGECLRGTAIGWISGGTARELRRGLGRHDGFGDLVGVGCFCWDFVELVGVGCFRWGLVEYVGAREVCGQWFRYLRNHK